MNSVRIFKKLHRLLTASAVVAAALFVTSCNSEDKGAAEQAEKRPAPTVIVEKVKMDNLQAVEKYTARVETKEKVLIQARVSGFLEKRNFEEGQKVKKGDLLYVIEKDTYKIAVEQAEAALANAKATQTLAQQTYKRISTLKDKSVVSRANLDEATSTLAQTKASVASAEATLNNAKLNLSYTDVVSPIDGRIGRSKFSVGNLVSPQSGALVTIVQEDPVYVTFPVPQKRYLEFSKPGESNEDKSSVFVQLELADGSTFNQKGEISFIDVETSQATDSIIVRAVFPNPDGLLLDEQIVQAAVIAKQAEHKLVAPQAALLLNQEGAYVLKIGEGNKIAVQPIVPGEQRGSIFVVEEGLNEGDQVVVSGHQRARPGQEVTPQMSKNPAQSNLESNSDVVITK